MISRKFTLVAGLVAALGLSGQAQALPTTTSPELVINISGASAQQRPLAQLLRSFCADNSLTIYEGADDNWISYFCTVDQSKNPTVIPASLDGVDVLFNNRAEGGSIWGVVPVARQWAVEYLNIFNSNCGTVTINDNGTPGDATDDFGESVCAMNTRATGLVSFNAGLECPFEVFTPDATEVYTTLSPSGTLFAHDGTTAEDTVCLKSDGGVSDVEPALFSAAVNFPGFTGGPLTTGELGSLTVLSEYGIIFGVSVNDRIYRQLQVAQGLATYADVLNPPATSDLADGTDLSDAARPSLPKTAIASLFSGKIRSFKELDPSLDSLSNAGPGLENLTAICRRVVGSGTQAANNIFLMGNPCLGATALTMVSNPAAGADGGLLNGQFVMNNSGSSDVERCQTRAQDGALPAFPGLTIDSIGFNAINRTLDTDEDWRFIKIDGIDPTVENVRAGKYNHVFEQTIQWPSSSSSIVVDALTMVAVGSGDPDTIVNAPINGVVALPTIGDWENDTITWRGSRNANSCSDVLLEGATLP